MYRLNPYAKEFVPASLRSSSPTIDRLTNSIINVETHIKNPKNVYLENKSLFEQLDNDAIMMILERLPHNTVLRLCKVSERFFYLCKDEKVKNLLTRKKLAEEMEEQREIFKRHFRDESRDIVKFYESECELGIYKISALYDNYNISITSKLEYAAMLSVDDELTRLTFALTKNIVSYFANFMLILSDFINIKIANVYKRIENSEMPQNANNKDMEDLFADEIFKPDTILTNSDEYGIYKISHTFDNGNHNLTIGISLQYRRSMTDPYGIVNITRKASIFDSDDEILDEDEDELYIYINTINELASFADFLISMGIWLSYRKNLRSKIKNPSKLL